MNLGSNTILWVGAFLLLQLVRVRGVAPLLGCLVTDEGAGSGSILTLSDGLYLYPQRNSSSKNQDNLSTHGELVPVSACSYSAKDAAANLETIEKLVNSFYSRYEEGIILRGDSIIGLIILEGQLQYLLHDHEQRLSPNLKSLLRHLHDSSGLLTSRISGKIVEANLHDRKLQAIYRNMDNLKGAHTWRDSAAIVKHLDEFENIGEDNEVFDPDTETRCMTSLLEDCTFPQLCKDAYLTDIHSQYMLLHQVFHQHIGQQRSCSSFSSEPSEKNELYADRLCSKAYLEAEYLASHGFPTRFVDLFAEQVGFCGLMGYPNFMRADWLREILSWREGSASGCMADLYGSRQLTDVKIKVPVVGRKDGKSEEECLLHLTSVSLIALAMNLRYIFDFCDPSLFNDYFSVQA